MIDTMKITVSTPTLTPRIVSDERSLFVAQRVDRHISGFCDVFESHKNTRCQVSGARYQVVKCQVSSVV